MKHLAAILCLIAASCAPKAIVVRPISEQAAVSRDAVVAVASHGKKVERTTSEIGTNVANLQADISKATLEAEHLREIGKATQRELDRNAAAWKAAEAKARLLEATASNLRLDVSDLQTAIDKARAESDKMVKKAHESDAAVKKLEARIADMTADYELGRTIRHAGWWIVGICILIVVGFIVLIVMNRAARAAASVATRGIIPP